MPQAQPLKPLTDNAFPESVTIPIVIRRVEAGEAALDGRPAVVATFALNSPHMQAPVAIGIVIPRDGYDEVLRSPDGRQAIHDLVANEAGNRICALASIGSAAKDAKASVADGPKLERLAIRFPNFDESSGKPTKAIAEIDGVDPESLQAVLRILRECAHPPAQHRTGGGILADAGHFRSDHGRTVKRSDVDFQPMVGAARGDHEARSDGAVTYFVDQVAINTFDVVRQSPSGSLDASYRVVAHCESKDDADAVADALRGAGETEPTEAEWLDEHVTQFFSFAHLTAEKPRAVSAMFHKLARAVMAKLPRNQQRTMALNKLVESKDCAVRALIAKTVEERKRESTVASNGRAAT